MLDIETILEYNMEKYGPFLGEDMIQDVHREFYRAYGASDGEENAVGVMVYEICDADNEEEDTKSRIRLLTSENDEALDLLQEMYREEGVYGEDIRESSYWLEEEKCAFSCERAGFSKERKESETVITTLAKASEIPFVVKLKKFPPYIRSIDSLSPEMFHQAVKDALFSGRKGLLEDLGYLEKEWFENTVSACTITDDKVSGLFLIRVTKSGIIEPVLLVASGPDSRQNLALMIAYAVKKGIERYPQTSQIRINRARKEITALVDKLFPGIKGNEAFFGIRKEG